MNTLYNIYCRQYCSCEEHRLLHLATTGGFGNMGNEKPKAFEFAGPQQREMPEMAGNIDQIHGNLRRQMSDDYKNVLHSVHDYQDKQLRYLSSEHVFMQRGYDPETQTSLGPQISLNGHRMGTYSLGYMQAQLNKNARYRRQGRRGLPDWQVQQYQQMICQASQTQLQNMQKHWGQSMNQFASRKAEQLGIEQPTGIDMGIQHTLEQREAMSRLEEGLMQLLEVVIEAAKKFFGALQEDVPEKEKLDSKKVENWLETTENTKELKKIAENLGMTPEALHTMIKEEDQWSIEKLKAFKKQAAETGEELRKLREKLSKEGGKTGAYTVCPDGIILDHPVGALHTLLGFSGSSMPKVVSFTTVNTALNNHRNGFRSQAVA